MESKKKQRISLFTFILSGVLFTMGGLLLIAESKIWFGLLQLAAGIFNFGAVAFRKKAIRARLELVVFLFNILVALSVAWDYMLAGKQYLQYAWFMAALLSCIALIITVRKKYVNP